MFYCSFFTDVPRTVVQAMILVYVVQVSLRTDRCVYGIRDLVNLCDRRTYCAASEAK